MRQQYHFRDVGSDVWIWDVHRLVQLSAELSVIDVPLCDISELDEDWWYKSPPNTPTPRSIAHHMQLAQAADLSYPIILCAEGRLMDGMHRALKALTNGMESIKAVRFDVTPEPDFFNRCADELPYD